MAAVEPRTTVSIHAAKTHLSRLVERAEQGEETVIARNGRPVARLVPYQQVRKPRVPGALRGQIKILPGFGEVDEEIAREFGLIDRPGCCSTLMLRSGGWRAESVSRRARARRSLLPARRST